MSTQRWNHQDNPWYGEGTPEQEGMAEIDRQANAYAAIGGLVLRIGCLAILIDRSSTHGGKPSGLRHRWQILTMRGTCRGFRAKADAVQYMSGWADPFRICDPYSPPSIATRYALDCTLRHADAGDITLSPESREHATYCLSL